MEMIFREFVTAPPTSALQHHDARPFGAVREFRSTPPATGRSVKLVAGPAGLGVLRARWALRLDSFVVTE